MASKSRGYIQDWDPMRDDFDNSNYDPQYPDEEASGQVNLDHSRLYLTNIPKGLSEEGLRAALSKYGTLLEVYVSKDPTKRYGLVSYETAGEARQAMMKLNRTEPLKLNISIAHKPKKSENNKRDGDKPRNQKERSRDDVTGSGRDRYSHRDKYPRERDDCSVGSRGRNNRKQEEMANGDNNISIEDLPVDLDDDLGLERLDPELQLELEQLQLEQLKLQQAQLQCKQRIILNQASRRTLSQNVPSSRCVLPGGKVVVRNMPDGNTAAREEGGVAAGAGDSLKLPGLQRVASRSCVVCGAVADSFCARCGVTPYCSPRCQQRDWAGRHRAVCHNLARLAGEEDQTDTAEEPSIPPPAPLRRPRSPAQKESFNYKRDNDLNSSRNDDASTKRFMPAGLNKKIEYAGSRGNDNSGFRGRSENSGPRNNNDNSGSRNNSGFRNDGEKSAFRNNTDNSGFHNNRDNTGSRNNAGFRNNTDNSGFRNNNRGPSNKGQDRALGSGHPYNQRYRDEGNVRPYNQPVADDDEDWDHMKPTPPKPAEPVQEVKPEPKATPAVAARPDPPKQEAPKLETAAKDPPKPAGVPPSSVTDVKPIKKLVPKNYAIETLPIGDTVFLQVDAAAADCRARGGFVCLAMNDKLKEDFERLCDQYTADCEADTTEYTPTPGETFSYFNAEDGGWYRARCLTPTLAALLDASKLVATAGSKCKRLPKQYEHIPEYCCLLGADDVKIGDSLKCTLQCKTANGYQVSLESVETAAKVGDGEVARWTPEVDYPKPASTAAPQQAIPEVSRPDLAANSKVLLVDMTALDRGFVRPVDAASQDAFNEILQRVVSHGMSADPLSEPPQKGQVVIAKYTDGCYYRALVQRTSVKHNKYLVEYIEFGNTQVTTLDHLYPCPADLQLEAHPAVTSQIAFVSGDADLTLTPPALQYLEKLKDDDGAELLLTLPSGVKSAPSGSIVSLTVIKSNEKVDRKLQAMCTPEWRQLEQRGGDVVESECLMFGDLKYVELPAGGCELDILDFSAIRAGTLSGCVRGLPHAELVFTQLTDKMGKYCESELGKKPYLPKQEELCIAQLPPYPQWFRAVFMEQVSGAGGAEADVCYVDYGNVERVPVSLLRKMLPEFVRGLPAVANTLEIRDFPKDASPEILAKALQFMQVNDKGRGVLRVTKCVCELPGMYVVDAPALIAAIHE